MTYTTARTSKHNIEKRVAVLETVLFEIYNILDKLQVTKEEDLKVLNLETSKPHEHPVKKSKKESFK